MIWLVSLSILSVTYHCMGSLLQGIASVFRACSAAFSFALCDGELAPDVAGSRGRRSRRSRRRSRKRSTSRTRSNRSPQIRINAYSIENKYSARNCIFCLILLGLMCATLSPSSRGFEAEKMRRLQELSSNLHLGITDSTICNWQELSALLGLVATSLRIMSYSVEFLAGLSWQLCNHFHPPTLRYSLAGGRGNAIFYKRSHVKDTMSEDKPHRENPDIFPYMKAYSYHNMKSAQDQREKRIVRKIKFTNIEAFYNSADTTTNSLHDFNYVKHRFTEQPSVSGICMISEAISLAWIYCAVSVAALCAAVCQVWQALDFVAELILNDQTDINPLHILKATLASITATCMRSKDSLVVVALTQSKINVSFVQFAKLFAHMWPLS